MSKENGIDLDKILVKVDMGPIFEEQTIKKLTYEEFGKIMHAALELNHFNGIRLGQALFDLSINRFPELGILKGTGADCFYNDSKIIHFIDAILEK